MSVTIRLATSSDSAALFREWQELRAHNAATDSRIVPSPVTETEFSAGLGELLARPTAAVFVAERKKELVGFIRAGVEHNQPDRLPDQYVSVGYLFVDPGCRREGIGQMLFDAVRKWASDQDGVGHFEMTVLSGDASAEGFWRSQGFVPFIQRLWAPIFPEPAK